VIQPVILAAGRGSRLGAAARGGPKCLVRLGGRSLLDWQRAALRAAGLPPPWLVVGHAGERVATRRGEHRVANPRWAEGGPIDSLRCVPPEVLADGFLLLYGDCVWHPTHLRRVAEARAAIAVGVDLDWHALWSARFESVLDDAETLRWGRGRRLAAIGARARTVTAIEGQFAGLVKFSSRGWRQACARLDAARAARRPRDTTALLAALVAHGDPVRGVPLRGRWLEVDSARDLALYRRRLRARASWSHDFRREAAWPAG
jgi:choline kinase